MYGNIKPWKLLTLLSLKTLSCLFPEKFLVLCTTLTPIVNFGFLLAEVIYIRLGETHITINKKKIKTAYGLHTPVRFNQQDFSIILQKNLNSVLNFPIKRFCLYCIIGLVLVDSIIQALGGFQVLHHIIKCNTRIPLPSPQELIPTLHSVSPGSQIWHAICYPGTEKKQRTG